MADHAVIQQQSEAKKRRQLITPEGVDLGLRLADGGQRVGAFLVDLTIMTVSLILLTLLCIAGAMAIGIEAGEFVAVIWLLGFFLLRNFYFVLMETGVRAATFGKRIVGIRVVARDGARLTADRVIVRNLLREIEFYLPLSFLSYNASEGMGGGWVAIAGLLWTAIFLFFPLLNRDRLRVGDLLAGTWVVNSPKQKLSLDQLQDRLGDANLRFSEAQLDVYGVFELQTLEQVLRNGNRDSLVQIAATISGKIGYTGDPMDAEDFLLAYYDQARRRMERGLLFGKRRAHKNDR